MTNLEDRVSREKDSYDHGNVYDESYKLQRRFNHVFTCPNSQRAERYIDEQIEQFAPGADILDYGCYTGAMTPRFARCNPKSITGIDISEYGVGKAQETFGDIASFHVGDAHRTPFPDESFDLIVGRSIIHHLEFEIAIREIHRILKPNGRAVFIEPLGDNPGAKLIRAITPKARTTDELPLSRAQIALADQILGGSEHLFINLASVPLAMATSLTPLRPDNWILKAADTLDQGLAATPLRYWMRSVVLVWKKTRLAS